MYCSKCGTQLPDEANFCWKCGLPVSDVPQPTTKTDEKWDTCEIEWIASPLNPLEFFGVTRTFRGKFIAKAVGQQGVYIVGETSELKPWTMNEGVPPPQNDLRTAVDNLIGKLTRAGWQPTDARGTHWYGHRFKKKVS